MLSPDSLGREFAHVYMMFNVPEELPHCLLICPIYEDLRADLFQYLNLSVERWIWYLINFLLGPMLAQM